ncbi:SMI1/KNR4 family protein [Anderseniella sp. Alg231-50]|uniref:SMI1/KNR4 family protein n=1 Tax=Anderseniella sp. Alg231-50 TaxID=1922226 RepID=UPI000D55A871
MDIQETLSQPCRIWRSKKPGASSEQLDQLISTSPQEVPIELLQLLSFSNGGEADLALEPMVFVIDPVEEIIESVQDEFLKTEFSGFLFFGGNGGLERFAIDLRETNQPHRIVAIDTISGPDSAEEIAPDLKSFVSAIGFEYTGKM